MVVVVAAEQSEVELSEQDEELGVSAKAAEKHYITLEKEAVNANCASKAIIREPEDEIEKFPSQMKPRK